MIVRHGEIEVATNGHGDIRDLTGESAAWLAKVGARDGQLTAFVAGSTAAITTIELEEGALRDLAEALERLVPSGRPYHHDRRWGDGNGFSHVRAALVGPSLTVPVRAGRAVLGTWQQAVLVECDNRPRRRKVHLTFVGAGGEE